jgi:3-dehydro-4-phosphotetronate decarboxylase
MSAAVQTGRDENRLREDVCTLGRSIFERGLTAGSSGNISVRLEDGWLFTPTNASLGRLDPARLSRLDASGKHVAGDPPSKESFLHRAMYEERDRAGAIVHLHSSHSAAVSCMDGLDHENCIPPLTAYFVMKIGRLPLIPYYRPGDPRLGDAIRGCACRHPAVLLANHGPVVSGATLEAAAYAIEELEETAKLFLLLRGTPARPLDDRQIAELEAVFGPAS